MTISPVENIKHQIFKFLSNILSDSNGLQLQIPQSSFVEQLIQD